ncbi:glycosyltransferase [uncultured Aquimarina sp.]|uniref:glycosyltransferase n=1 Tax=uncultured Aquimarina sp. TaxID=575652 RepID=UPI002617F292|nr:glycosyltransferase [uncultured Aquimarina sp.]
MNKTLGIFGPFPPPLGGISVHIKRIKPFLDKEGIDYTIYNHGNHKEERVVATNKSPLFYLKLLFSKQYSLFHFHQFFFFHFFYYMIFSFLRREKIIVTIHSERILGYNKIIKSLVLFVLTRTRRLQLISVSKNLNDYLNENKIKSIFLPAYVPPIFVKEKKIESKKKLFLFSVWKFNQKLANEIYNVPLAFEYLRRNKDDFTMLFMIGSESNSDLIYLKQILEKYDVSESVEVIFDENLVDYVKNCEFIIRPNLSDGYGVSIQEAMDLGVPAIASNVCERPKGAVLFKNDDIEDLSRSITYVMNTERETILEKKDSLTYHKELIEIYIKNI